MKKYLLLTAALILAHLIVSDAAFARVQNFTHFSIDVADGWTATEDEDSVVSILSPDGATMINLLLMERESPRKLDDVAMFKQGLEMEGFVMSPPRQVGDDLYAMNGMKNGVQCAVAIMFEGDRLFSILHVNPQAKYKRDFERMRDSFEMHY